MADRPPDVTEAAANLQSHATSNVSNVAQRAALAALTGAWTVARPCGPPSTADAVTIHRMLNECDGVTCVEPEGAFYAFPSVRACWGASSPGGPCRRR